MFNKYLGDLYKKTAYFSRDNIIALLKLSKKGGTLLDIGCWDGITTSKWARAVSASEAHGIELVSQAVKKARKRGIKVAEFDIDAEKWPYPNNHFDYIVSNLVIEHLKNVDHFISESYRILKRGGITVVSTNNLASWHNIFCLLIGWTPFDLTNTTTKRWSIGNPLAIHKQEDLKYGSTFTHKCVYTNRWLKEWYELYGFKYVKTMGAGYYPLPPFLGKIDKLHSALITLSFVKE